MGYQLKKPVFAKEIAQACELELVGENLTVTQVDALSHMTDGSLGFTKASLLKPITSRSVLIAAATGSAQAPAVLVAEQPRLAFAKALNFLELFAGFHHALQPPSVHATARVSPHAILGLGVIVGANTTIGHFTVIGEGVRIGENCVIKSNAVIGEDGFGFERDELGVPIRMLHLGSVRLGNYVEVGNFTTVSKGTLGDTVVEDYAKFDDHVHIAHNCHIGVGAIVTACAEFSGGVVLGRQSWVGPNASIIQKCKIGDKALIGIGANVLRDVAEGMTVAGNPARLLLRQ